MARQHRPGHQLSAPPVRGTSSSILARHWPPCCRTRSTWCASAPTGPRRTRTGMVDTDEVDWQLEAAERAGKRVIMCLGPIKSFGYPEYSCRATCSTKPSPGHLIDGCPIPRCSMRPRGIWSAWCGVIGTASRSSPGRSSTKRRPTWLGTLLAARENVFCGMRWRPSANDPAPDRAHGFLPASTVVLAHQWWRTRDQGDSGGRRRAVPDIVGIDYYARHAVTSVARWSVYLDGATGILPGCAGVAARQGCRQRTKVMVTEGRRSRGRR